MNKIEDYNKTIFESIKHIDELDNEYWYARELQKVLEYSQWRRFEETIQRAKMACKESNNNVLDNFANVGKIVNTGVATKTISDYKLSRYACYLIAQNGDSHMKVIALAQTYFAYQTRKQELVDEEFADNLFRIVQTNSKLKKDKVDNEYSANNVHYEIGKKVRKAIKDMGGTMPEDLPSSISSIKKIENKERSENK